MFPSKMESVCMLSHVQLFGTPWTGTHKAPLSIRFSREKYWSGLSLPSPGGLPKLGIKPGIKLKSPASPALAGEFFTTAPPRKPEIEHGGKN